MGILTGDDRIGTIPLALAYFAAILLWNPPMPWVAAAGRMALTNYLLQFVVFGFIFYGYGLGQFGSWGVGLTCAAGLVFYCAQLAASHWWLQRFHFGPFEWLWRSVSYRQWQPLYRTEEARMFSSRALYLLLPATFLILPIVHLGLPWLLAQLGPHWGWRNGHPGPLNWLGVLPILGGAALLAWILAAMLGNVKRLPPRIRFGLRPAAFLESGPYALCRHPMYVAEGCLWVGVSVLAGSPIVVAALACGLIFASAWLIPHEEAALIHQFGDSYRAYRARVPALPKPR
jgi:protein-S-isoprenylcysteine O-methyltransferase Ste14